MAVNGIDKTVLINFPKEIAELTNLGEVTVQMYSTNYNESEFMEKG